MLLLFTALTIYIKRIYFDISGAVRNNKQEVLERTNRLRLLSLRFLESRILHEYMALH
jgi:hypothetical protein